MLLWGITLGGSTQHHGGAVRRTLMPLFVWRSENSVHAPLLQFTPACQAGVCDVISSVGRLAFSQISQRTAQHEGNGREA